MLTPINSQNHPLSECTANEITDYIIRSKLKPGDKLPTEAELCQEFCVSRTTIREAIKILGSRNIVTISRGVGTFVSEAPGIAEDPFGFKFFHDKQRLFEELIELRSIIETQLAGLAAENASDEEISHLEEIESSFEDAVKSQSDFKTIDEEFHVAIATATHNELISLVLPLLVKKIDGVELFPSGESAEHAIAAHRQLIDAVKRKKKDEAADVMRNHLSKHLEDFKVVETI